MADLVVAISTGNDFLHVGSAAALLSHHPDGQPAPATAVDFFDSAGVRLEPMADVATTGTIGTAGTGFHAADSSPDPDAVLTRINLVLDRAQAALEADPDLGRKDDQEYVTQVPRPTGDLSAVLAVLAAECGLDDSAEHSAGWFHNLMHRVG